MAIPTRSASAFARLGVEADAGPRPRRRRARRAPRPPRRRRGGLCDGAACARPGWSSRCKRRTKPLLGICLGMQMLFDASDEGDTPLLGLIPGRVRALDPRPAAARPAHGLDPDRRRRPGHRPRGRRLCLFRAQLRLRRRPRDRRARRPTAAPSPPPSATAICGARNSIPNARRPPARAFLKAFLAA